MGIVEAELAAFELSAFESVRIEHNANGDVHLHLDDVRVDLSPREFDQLAAAVEEARETLGRLKE